MHQRPVSGPSRSRVKAALAAVVTFLPTLLFASSPHAPCENFYASVCSQAIPGETLSTDSLSFQDSFDKASTEMSAVRMELVRTLLNGSPHVSQRSKRLRQYVLACTSEAGAKREESELVKATLARIDAVQSKRDFRKLVEKHIDTPYQSFVKMPSVPNLDTPEWNDVALIAGGLTTLADKADYAKPEALAAVQDLATSLFTNIKLDKPGERAAAVMDFERRLALTLPPAASFSEIMTSRTYSRPSHLLRAYPMLNLERVLKGLPKRTLIRNMAPQTLAFLNKALDRESLFTLKSVYIFAELRDKLGVENTGYLEKRRLVERKVRLMGFRRAVGLEDCARETLRIFPKEIDAEVIARRLVTPVETTEVASLAEALRQALLLELDANTWLSAKAKRAVLSKLRALRFQVGQPLNEAEWNFTPNVELSANNPIANQRRLLAEVMKVERQALSKKRLRSRWVVAPLSAEVRYSPQDNSITIPLGVLRPPFFSSSETRTRNLATLGSIVAHELSHVLDNEGARFDAAGRLADTMSLEDLRIYFAKVSTLTQNVERDALSQMTTHEFVADVVGLHLAHKVAFAASRSDEKEEQNFFAEYARMWCAKPGKTESEVTLASNVQRLAEARVNEALKRFAPFAKAYSCTSGQGMFQGEAPSPKLW